MKLLPTLEVTEKKIKAVRMKANKKIMGERSLRKRLKVTSKDELGYSSHDPVARALGFRNNYEVNIHSEYNDDYVFVGRLFNAVRGLLESGYEIIIPESLANEDLTESHKKLE